MPKSNKKISKIKKSCLINFKSCYRNALMFSQKTLTKSFILRSSQQINNSLYWRENIEKFLSADIICSQMQNCELRGTDHIQGRIYEHIFARIIGYCVYHPSNILQHTQKTFFEQLSCFSAWNVFLIVLPTSVTITKRDSLILN